MDKTKWIQTAADQLKNRGLFGNINDCKIDNNSAIEYATDLLEGDPSLIDDDPVQTIKNLFLDDIFDEIEKENNNNDQ